MKSKQLRKQGKLKLASVLTPEPEEQESSTKEVTLTSAESGKTMHFRLVMVTPVVASRWLEKNHPDNRTVAWNRVEALANDIRNGSWKLMHQGVAFGENGYLIDGQHRLHAIVQAGQPAEVLVVRNEGGTYQDPIDRGGARSIAAIMGVNTRQAAAFNMLRCFENGFEIHTPMTLADAETVYERHKSVFEKLAVVRNRAKILGPTLAACAWALPISGDRVLDFAGKMASGEMIARGDPVYALRSWSERNKRIGSWQMAMASLNCIRYFVQDVKISSVYVGESGYRAITGRRRALKVPHTPSPDVVPSVGWAPDARGRLRESDGE